MENLNEYIGNIFTYSFMTRAFIAGSLISLCAALLGVILVLKRFSMIGDGLSHLGFGTVAIALALNLSPLFISLPVSIISAILLLKVSGNSSVKGDALVAIISTSAMAIGITVTTLTSGLNTDINAYMFGSILAIGKEDVWVSIILALIVIPSFFIFYHRIFAVTFDETFAHSSGIKTKAYNTFIAVLTACTVIIGMRLIGALMISSLIIFPPLSSMRIFKSFFKVVISSTVISVFCFGAGIIISFYASTPAGASIVLVHLAVFLISIIAGKITKR